MPVESYWIVSEGSTLFFVSRRQRTEVRFCSCTERSHQVHFFVRRGIGDWGELGTHEPFTSPTAKVCGLTD